MPINSNKGFGLVPVLVIVSVLSVTSLGVYSYFYGSLNSSAENVLQANTGYNPTQVDVTSFLMRNLFNVSNLGEFNRNNTPLILSMSDRLDNCVFLPRTATPLVVNYNYQGKRFTARVYQNVKIQVLPNSISSKNYMVVIPNPGSIISFNTSVAYPISNSCGQNVNILAQPNTPISATNFSSLILGNAGINPVPSVRPSVPSTRPNPVPTVVKPSAVPTRVSIAPISQVPARAQIEIRSQGNSTSLVVTPTSDSKQTNLLLADYFKNRGITVTLNSGRSLNVKNVQCKSSGCDTGFTVSIPQGNPTTSTTNTYLVSIDLPFINNQTSYEYSYVGKQRCEGPTLSGPTYSADRYRITFSTAKCLIGMLN